MGGAVAATVGVGASPIPAEDVTARSAEVVAREAPGKGEAGIAVLRGTDRVQLLGERDGWSEIRLPDGRRAWVPAAELVRNAPPAPTSPLVTMTPPGASAPADDASDASPASDPTAALANEIDRLGALLDALESRQADASRPGAAAALPESAVWVLGGVALAVGLVIGSGLERFRSRRDRSLRF